MASKRKAISKKLRFDVFKRDEFTCQYCGKTPPSVTLQADHINPVANGGENNIDNLATSCSECNLGKGARLLTDIPKPLKLKAAEIKEKEAQIEGYNRIFLKKRQRILSQSWEVVEELEGSEVEKYNTKRFSSVKLFLDKLPLHEVLEAAEITNEKWSKISEPAFRYFCAICWRKIRAMDNA